jgi:transposase
MDGIFHRSLGAGSEVRFGTQAGWKSHRCHDSLGESLGEVMKGFVQGADRQQTTLLPECLDDWVDESNPVRAVDVFVDALELRELGFDGVDPVAIGRPAYHPSPMLKLYIYGYLNRVQSSRRLEREAGRNLEVMWLTGRLVPDHKTIADFRKDNGPAIKKACAQFVALCRKMGLLEKASVAIDGSKFKGGELARQQLHEGEGGPPPAGS